jgi:sugar (pentulose or hexulose) kinase
MRAIGIDIGTSSVKAVLCSIGSEVVVERTVGKPYDEDGRPTRDPYLWAPLAETTIAEQ